MNDINSKSKNQIDPYLKLGFILILVCILFFWVLSHIIFLSPLVVMLSPTIFLLGISLLLTGLLIPSHSKKNRPILLIFFVIILGLNTRIPSIVEDIFQLGTITHINKKLTLAVGDPIFVDSNVNNLYARNFIYGGVNPRCNEGFCALIQGYSPPSRAISYFYWTENLTESIRSFGYTTTDKPENAPSLKIRAFERDNYLKLHLELFDKNGVSLATENRTYRNGFPFESTDLSGLSKTNYPFMWSLEYLLHGNYISTLVAHIFGYSRSKPIGYFLNASINRYTEQDDPQLTQNLVPKIDKDTELNPPIDIMIVDKWKPLFIDDNRASACNSVLSKPEAQSKDFTVGETIEDSSQSRQPYKFVEGKTGNEKLLVIGVQLNDMLCEGDYLYYFPRTHNYKVYEIYKYKSDGTMIFHVSFNMPESKYGFVGMISPPSLKESDGVLRFDYVDIYNSGPTVTVNRIRKMSLSPKVKQL